MNGGFLNKFLGGGNDESNNNENNQNNNNNNNENNNNNNQNNDNKGNNENNIDNSSNIWENKQNSEENNQQNQQQNQQQQQNENQLSPDEALQTHIDDLNLTDGIDFAKIQADMQTGDTETLNKAFETVAANAYKSSMMQMNKIMDTKIAAVKEQALQDSKASMDAAAATREMNTKLPFTTAPNVAPVAKAVLNQLIKSGQDLPTAIQGTAKFFKDTVEMVNGNGQPPSNQNSSNFNQNESQNNSNNNNDNSSPSDHDEWLDLLSA